jgi:hypothetical protein
MSNLEKIVPESDQSSEHLFSMEEISRMKEGDDKIKAIIARIDHGIKELRADRKLDKIEVEILIGDLETAKELYLGMLSKERPPNINQPKEIIH